MVLENMSVSFENDGNKFTFYKDWCGFPMTNYNNIISIQLVSKTVKKLFIKKEENKIVIERKLTGGNKDTQEINVTEDEINNARDVVDYISNYIESEKQRKQEEAEKQRLATEERKRQELLYQEAKRKREEKENERINGKARYSKNQFDFIDDNYYLKYSYYDVHVQGSKYIDFDISKIQIDKPITFIPEPENEYDNNAIRINYGEQTIGYVPKNKLQEMLHNYLNQTTSKVEGFIHDVDEEKKEIKIAIGFYRELTEEEMKSIPHMDVSLTKTSKKDDFGMSRQDHLEGCDEGEVVDLDYQYDTDTYLVTDSMGNELGEISSSKSEKLNETEKKGKSFQSIILNLDYNDSGKITCKIRIFFNESY